MLKLTPAVAALLLTAAPLAAAAPAPRAPQVAVTDHVGTFGGTKVAYRATVAEHFVPDAKGQPGASVITIAYTRTDVGDPARRPVLFLFNGGPGASSSPTHLGLGPKKRAVESNGPAPAGPSALVDNPYSPLDQFDMVFIDPVGTGFSRAFPGEDPKQWYSLKDDAVEVAGVIEEWLKANHREASPRFMLGESYGTARAAAILKYAKALKVDGVALVAVVGDTPGHEMPYVAALPTMAAGAWYHNRIDRAGRSVEQVYREAVEFARTDYVSALIQGSSLPAAEKRRIAEKMSKLIGLPADFIAAHDLRISKNDYMFNLLKGQTLRTGLLDVRVTAPLEPGQLGDIDDPALGVAPKRKPGAPAGPPPNPASIGPVRNETVETYLRNDLKFATPERYYGINFTANSQWRWGGEPKFDVGGPIAAAMKEDPKLRLFWAGGYYDLTTPVYATRYTFDQAGVPAERVTAAEFEGPHGVYEGDKNLAAFTAALKAFVGGGTR